MALFFVDVNNRIIALHAPEQEAIQRIKPFESGRLCKYCGRPNGLCVHAVARTNTLLSPLNACYCAPAEGDEGDL